MTDESAVCKALRSIGLPHWLVKTMSSVASRTPKNNDWDTRLEFGDAKDRDMTIGTDVLHKKVHDNPVSRKMMEFMNKFNCDSVSLVRVRVYTPGTLRESDTGMFLLPKPDGTLLVVPATQNNDFDCLLVECQTSEIQFEITEPFLGSSSFILEFKTNELGRHSNLEKKTKPKKQKVAQAPLGANMSHTVCTPNMSHTVCTPIVLEEEANEEGELEKIVMLFDHLLKGIEVFENKKMTKNSHFISGDLVPCCQICGKYYRQKSPSCLHTEAGTVLSAWRDWKQRTLAELKEQNLQSLAVKEYEFLTSHNIAEDGMDSQSKIFDLVLSPDGTIDKEAQLERNIAACRKNLTWFEDTVPQSAKYRFKMLIWPTPPLKNTYRMITARAAPTWCGLVKALVNKWDEERNCPTRALLQPYMARHLNKLKRSSSNR